MTNPLPILPPGDIDAAWVTRALAEAGIGGTVESIAIAPVGTGQVADTFRISIGYSGTPPTGAPASLVGKFPSADPGSKAAAKMFNIYRNETLFYQRLAATARMRVPKPYVALFEYESHDFVVLLEDLGGSRQGDQMRGCTLEEARIVAREAARLHASHWDDPALLAADWVLKPDAAWGFYTAEIMNQLYPGFVERYAARLAPEVREVADALVANYATWNARLPTHRAITHNDFRPDNMLFATRPDAPPVVVVDWQTMTLGTGAVDLVYFIGGAFDRETRLKHEGELIDIYLDELRAGGVRDYGRDALMADYRHLSFVGCVMAIGASMLVKQTERGDLMFMTMLERAAHHALDLEAMDALKG
jgi:thiamine kinase-like enzyme